MPQLWRALLVSLLISAFLEYVTCQKPPGKEMPQEVISRQQMIEELSNMKDLTIDYSALSQLGASEHAPVKCVVDTLKIVAAVATMKGWAFKYIDASAKVPAGILNGNLKWLGDFDECYSIPRASTFGPRFCTLGIGLGANATSAPLTLGACVPDTCDSSDLVNIINLILPKALKVVAEKSSCHEVNPPMDNEVVIAITLFSLIAAFLLIGLIIDIYRRLTPQPKADPASQTPVKGSGDIEAAKKAPKKADKAKGPVTVADFVFCFSPLTAFEKIFKPPGASPPGPIDLGVINGIRTLSLFWVMLAHQYMMSIFSGIDNIVSQMELQDRWTFQFVINGMFAVDSFLFLSGFLAYFSLSKIYAKSKSLISFIVTLPKVWFLRYLRLTPPYAAAILIQVGLWHHLYYGPLYPQRPDKGCQDNWWSHLIYVNNFAESMSSFCLAHTWYLPVDMQLYLASPFFIYALVRKPVVGWIMISLALVAQFVCGATLSAVYNLRSSVFSPMHFDFNGGNITLPDTPSDAFFDVYYNRPYTRMGPFIIGVIGCHILVQHYKWLQEKIFSRLWPQAIGWFIALGIFGSLVYGETAMYRGEYTNPLWVEAVYNSVARTAWGVMLAWIIVASATKHGGIVADFLSWAYWVIPARISYCTYLIQPFVIFFYMQSLRQPFHVTDITMIFFYVATSFGSLLCAVILSIAFESPTIGVLTLLLK